MTLRPRQHPRPLSALIVGLLSLAAAGEPCTVGDADAACDKPQFCLADAGGCAGAGTCADRAQMCIEVYDPVCGCDGTTYANACRAVQAGVNVASNGECGGAKVQGEGPSAGDSCIAGNQDVDCGKQGFCQLPAGACGGRGTCLAVPEMCTADVTPVCGCDGNTYDNACSANAARVSVASEGRCGGAEAEAEDQDGSCTTDDQDTACGREGFCLIRVKAEGCNGAGTCADRPEMCIETYDPVCGCDGTTYDNQCKAAQAGVNVVRGGECSGAQIQDDIPSVGDSCIAGNQDVDCGKEAFCQLPTGACGGRGACLAVPEMCTADVTPVCGCDGITYDNECSANAARMSVASDGECGGDEAEGQGDDCSTDDQDNACGREGFCYLATEGCNGTGTCADRPEMCTMDMTPVCGCDGTTYDNQCKAARAGVNVVSKGECDGAKIPGVGASTSGSCIAGNQNVECGKEGFCQLPAGACEGSGSCLAVPEMCNKDLRPVCGCDGNTYDNACLANAAKVSIASEGKCRGAEAEDQDGSCTTDDQDTACGREGFCLVRVKAEGCNGAGTCADRPEMCIEIYDPVCGCDGTTHDNQCKAAQAGVNVVRGGECSGAQIQDDIPSASDSCIAGNQDVECGKEGFCQLPTGTCGGRGACLAVPEICTADVTPVCGCNGNTYDNVCSANAARVSVASEGKCDGDEAEGQGDDCSTDDQDNACGKEGFCQLATEGCNGTGTCADRPEMCTMDMTPVCGCDGTTYDNQCKAAQAGVNVVNKGECDGAEIQGDSTIAGQSCIAGNQDADCGKEFFCQLPAGTCGGSGACLAVPEMCTADMMPVCGCDGNTYDNACSANAARVSVASKGKCDGDEAKGQGDDCSTDDQDNACGKEGFCHLATEGCNGTGTCTYRPEMCTMDMTPVCGCDGMTYDNQCKAAQAGVNVASKGECGGAKVQGGGASASGSCTAGNQNVECGKEGFCQLPTGFCGARGLCLSVPEMCTADITPVCGCDGTTYDNECSANAARVSVASEGECGGDKVQDNGTGDDCTGDEQDEACGKEGMCLLPTGDCDATGACLPVPEMCTADVTPVCGCDGNTYDNGCMANAARVSVASEGECKGGADGGSTKGEGKETAGTASIEKDDSAEEADAATNDPEPDMELSSGHRTSLPAAPGSVAVLALVFGFI